MLNIQKSHVGINILIVNHAKELCQSICASIVTEIIV